jgi:hypothetical protein
MHKLCVVGLFCFLVLVLTSVAAATTYTVTSDISGRVYVNNEVYSFEDSLSARLYVKPSIVPLFNTTQRFFGAEVNIVPVYPPINASFSYVAGTNTLTITWEDSNNSDSTVLVRNNNSIPSSASDGTVLYNGSAETFDIVVSTGESFYLSLFGYSATAIQYSTGVNVPWGVVGVNAYNVNTGADISGYTVFISNQAGTETYRATGATNPYSVGFEDIPTGSKCIVTISASGYSPVTQYHDLYTNTFFNLSFHLAPVSPPGAGDCSLISFFDTTTVTNPDVDAVITLTHPLVSLISVELYNSSLYTTYGGWMTVSSTYYSYNTTHVVVNASILDSNTTMVRASYHYQYCVGDVESLLYTVKVIDSITQYGVQNPVHEAYVEIKQYLSHVGGYVVLSSFYTDATGQGDVWLVPSTNYKVTITKDGYETTTSDWITSPIHYGVQYPKVFFLAPITPDLPGYDSLSNITFTATMNHDNTIYITYNDINSSTINTQIYVYEVWNNTLSLNYSLSQGVVHSFDFYVTGINTSRTYKIYLYFNNTANFPEGSSPLIRTVYAITYPVGDIDFDELVTNLIGPFTINNIPIGWHYGITLFVAFMVLLCFGVFNAGVGMIGMGLSIGLMDIVFALMNNRIPALTALGVIIIAIGILYIWTKGKPEEHL